MVTGIFNFFLMVNNIFILVNFGALIVTFFHFV